MYLQSIHLINTGPLQRVNIELPFVDGRPLPLVLVGPNGSGKSTVLSFVVNALITFRQQVSDDVEIEAGRVYRVRSPLGIRSGENYFHARVKFDNELELNEWQLDRSRTKFEADLGWTPTDPKWNKIPEHETSHFDPEFGSLSKSHKLEAALNSGCILFFGADRFEPPDWLNTENFSSELKLPEPTRLKGRTLRRMFARNRLKPTLEWVASLVLDLLLHEHQSFNIPVPATGTSKTHIAARIPTPGASTAAFNSIIAILKEIIGDDPEDRLTLSIGDRHSRIVSATLERKDGSTKTIRDLLSLSAGESALFCLFASIIRDADLAKISFSNPSDIHGIVLIDEIDLHLHLGMQHKVLPKLLALFPKVQFILTVHSPLVVLGMDKTFGSDGFVVLEMPSGKEINSESYSEFLNAFDVYSKTRRFEDQLLNQVNAQSKPAILVEGISDKLLIDTAWQKLNNSETMPFEVIPCGIEPDPESRNGGAEMLRRCLEFLAIASDRTVIALFDNDYKGNGQFKAINIKSFEQGIDEQHKRHKKKQFHAILLPVPEERTIFVTPENIHQRYLAIEHYFADTVLEENAMKGASILGTSVFEIQGEKVLFAQKTIALDQDAFANFEILFKRILSIIK